MNPSALLSPLIRKNTDLQQWLWNATWTPEFSPPEHKAPRSIPECLHWGMHILHYRVTLTRTPELAWMLILASSAGGLSTGLQYMCRWDNCNSALVGKTGYDKGGIKHRTEEERDFSLKVVELYLGEGWWKSLIKKRTHLWLWPSTRHRSLTPLQFFFPQFSPGI